MARINYYAIEEAIKAILDADVDVQTHWDKRETRIIIEREIIFGMDECPCVLIYLDRREAPANMQGLSGGQRTRMSLHFSLWVAEFHLDSVAEASQNRDDLMGLVEVALMKERTLNDTVGVSWLDGGEFLTAQTDNGFISCGEILLAAEQVATTI
jgi:hypothetical protein